MQFLVRAVGCGVLALLAGCGGGSDDSGRGGPSVCSPAGEKEWLAEEMDTYYFWAGRSPLPPPENYGTVREYLEALRFLGDEDEPKDRFSYIESKASFDQFFVEGTTLGYGVSVNGTEGTLPLKVRYVDPNSPAAVAGVKRGETIVSANGKPAADLVAAGDFSLLTPGREGDVLTLVLQSASGTRTVTLTGDTYALVPVTAASVLNLPNGKKVGYLSLKDFITQAEGPLAEAIEDIRAQQATELIVDLRYNGGGRVSTATRLASLITGETHAGKRFTLLKHNPERQQDNAEYLLTRQPGAAFTRVVVLTGPRTCSASEMLANGLKPYVDVVTIGGTSCGKPVGFSPQDHCGSVYSLVNFEALNARGEGKYYNGLPLTCTVKDDFARELGDASETLTASALTYLQTGACPAAGAGTAGPLSRVLRAPGKPVVEPGSRWNMVAD